jgi:predicted porin
MNKKLLAVAIAGVLAPPLAHAQTANVTLYGRLNLDAEVIINAKQDLTADNCTDPSNCAKQNFYRLSSNSSRLGVKGTESLGGGLNAIFQIESGFDASNSGGQFATRETFVGLQGGWGTFKAGYFLAPYDDVQSIFGSVPTLQTGILGSQSIWSNTGWPGNSSAGGSFDDRVANSLRYDSPNMAGFTGSFQVGGRDTGGCDGGDVAQQRRHAYIMSMDGQYNNGPLRLGIAYEVHNNTRTGTALVPNLQDQAMTFAGSWNFGIIQVGAAWEQVQYDIPVGSDTQTLKRDFWGISGTGNLGPGQYYIAYFKANDGKGVDCTTVAGITTCPRVGAVTGGPNSGAQQWEVSYTYPLSKRTLLYTGYTMIDNDNNGAYNFGVNQISGVCTGNVRDAATGNNLGCGDAARPQGFVAGMVHFF